MSNLEAPMTDYANAGDGFDLTAYLGVTTSSRFLTRALESAGLAIGPTPSGTRGDRLLLGETSRRTYRSQFWMTRISVGAGPSWIM